ncbi:MAG: 4-alpha-glucanotransferase [Candidatus Tantalella remota]|nr:4-alpha-glucanotransferase [Candidatus Tantalella remota]
MDQRGSGVLLHITSLPSKYGIGDLGPAAYAFADTLAEAGQKYWQILPLNPIDGANANSPYFSNSAFAANSLLISPERLRDEEVLLPEDLPEYNTEDPHTVDYDSVAVLKGPLLDKAYERFKVFGVKDDLEVFCANQLGWLNNFALFVALKEEFDGKIWIEWPQGLRDRDPEAVAAAKEKHSERIDKEKFIQYIIYRQWKALKLYCNKKGVKVIGDIPIYVSYDSVDVWVTPGIFKLDDQKKQRVVAGVPPDYFSDTGQLWSNPVYDWEVLKEEGYSWWIERMRHTLNCYDIVRIDHFRGLVQYWEVPAREETAINGEWKEVPTYDLIDTMMRELPDFFVLAEDLGIITDDVREAMKHYSFPGMRILQFAFGEDDQEHPYLPHNYVKNCIAYPGTHDNNTMKGWLDGESTEDERRRLLEYMNLKEFGQDIVWDIIRLLMTSIADTVIFPVQDILGLGGDARMNKPQTTDGNWSWRIAPGEWTDAHTKKLRELTEAYGRI